MRLRAKVTLARVPFFNIKSHRLTALCVALEVTNIWRALPFIVTFVLSDSTYYKKLWRMHGEALLQQAMIKRRQ